MLLSTAFMVFANEHSPNFTKDMTKICQILWLMTIYLINY